MGRQHGASQAAQLVLRKTSRWWETAAGYEIYLRSFMDTNADGVGDLPGVVQRLDYLAWLGIGMIWLTPFYPSPMRDHGYDVAGYCDVDPRYGTLADFGELVSAAHARGLRVLIDICPNHTSSDHPWFRAARSSRDNSLRDYYIWRDPAPGGGPPNNWLSHSTGGPAWTFDENTGQYWLHLYLPEQPDLNWASPGVRREFDDILRFWLRRGVDGFRIDVADGLVKHPALPDNPVLPAGQVVPQPGDAAAWFTQEHRYDMSQPGVHDIYRRWRQVVEPSGALLLGEVGSLDAQTVARFVRHDTDGLHLSFWFKPMTIGWAPGSVREVLETAVAAAGDRIAWVQGNHDRPRAASRFGGGEPGRRRALALAALMMALPGVPFIYQGDELGLTDGEVAPWQAADPVSRRAGDHDAGRDRARTPMPWDSSDGMGFTTAARPWLPFGGRTPADTVAWQKASPDSWLYRYRQLLRIRRDLVTPGAQLVWLDTSHGLVAYQRGRIIAAANCGQATADLRLPEGRWQLAFASAPAAAHISGASVRLCPDDAVILARQ